MQSVAGFLSLLMDNYKVGRGVRMRMERCVCVCVKVRCVCEGEVCV